MAHPSGPPVGTCLTVEFPSQAPGGLRLLSGTAGWWDLHAQENLLVHAAAAHSNCGKSSHERGTIAQTQPVPSTKPSAHVQEEPGKRSRGPQEFQVISLYIIQSGQSGAMRSFRWEPWNTCPGWLIPGWDLKLLDLPLAMVDFVPCAIMRSTWTPRLPAPPVHSPNSALPVSETECVK